jgi:hypothetical protein
VRKNVETERLYQSPGAIFGAILAHWDAAAQRPQPTDEAQDDVDRHDQAHLRWFRLARQIKSNKRKRIKDLEHEGIDQ